MDSERFIYVKTNKNKYIKAVRFFRMAFLFGKLLELNTNKDYKGIL